MLANLLIGLAAGQRAMTPPAVLAVAARRGDLPPGAPGARLLRRPGAVAALLALAVAEMAGDKLPFAPDRTVPPGLLARTFTAAFAGAAVAPRGRHGAGAAMVALGTSFAGLALRRRSMAAFGRVSSGLGEDAAVVLCAALAVGWARRS